MLFKGLKRGLSLFSSTIYRGHSRSQTPSVTLGIQISLLEHQSTNDANRQNSVKNSPRTGTTSKTTVQNRIVGGCERQGGRRSEAPSDARGRATNGNCTGRRRTHPARSTTDRLGPARPRIVLEAHQSGCCFCRGVFVYLVFLELLSRIIVLSLVWGLFSVCQTKVLTCSGDLEVGIAGI